MHLTPDALLNGEALMSVLKNCLPNISDVNKLVEPDINTLMLGIKIASTGPTLDYETNCPKCNKEHNFQINLTNILETQTFMDEDDSININGELVIHVRPYNFEQRNLTLLNEIDEAQTAKLLNDREDLDDIKKVNEVGKHGRQNV